MPFRTSRSTEGTPDPRDGFPWEIYLPQRSLRCSVFCTVCGSPAPEGAQFCSNCGSPAQRVGSDPPLASSSPTMGVPLTSARHFVLLFDTLALRMAFQIQDPSGKPLGEAQGGNLAPVSGAFTVVDNDQKVVLVLDSARERGLNFVFRIHDSSGTVLATLRPKSSFMSRKYSISVGSDEVLLLTTDAPGLHYQISEIRSGAVLATGSRALALRTSRTEVTLPEGHGTDPRILLGTMILACSFTIR